MSTSGGASMHLSAVITVHKYEPSAYEEPPEGPSLVKIHVEETFSGDIDGDGVAEFLQVARADGSASLLASSESRARWRAGRARLYSRMPGSWRATS